MPTIETTETIDAPPPTVWAALVDIDSYPEWNPFIVEGRGEFSQGEKVELRMQPPGGKAMTFEPKVIKVEPDRELRWVGRLAVPGLFRGEHYFKLTPDGDGTLLEHGEHFSGLLPRFMGKTLTRTEAGFVALNQGLKERAEGPARTKGE